MPSSFFVPSSEDREEDMMEYRTEHMEFPFGGGRRGPPEEEVRWTVRDMPERLRPSCEMDRLGVEHVSDDVLLALVLRTGIHGCNVVDLARKLLRRFGSLTDMAKASVDELSSERGVGKAKAQAVLAALELASRMSEEAFPRRYRVRSAEEAARLLRDKARTLATEVFWALLLDAKNCLKGRPVDISRGLLDASLVHPREVFREAIRSASAALVLVHNHPSGDPSPSAEDVRITKQLVEAGKIVDIKVLDHVIIGHTVRGFEVNSADPNGGSYMSMREEGICAFS